MDKIQAAIEEFKAQGYDQNEEDLMTDLVILQLEGQENPIGGKIRILKNKENGRCRVLMRNNKHDVIMLNHYINPGIKFEVIQQKAIKYTTTDFAESQEGKKKNITLTFPPERINNVPIFHQKLLEAQEINKQILDSKK